MSFNVRHKKNHQLYRPLHDNGIQMPFPSRVQQIQSSDDVRWNLQHGKLRDIYWERKIIKKDFKKIKTKNK